MARLPITGDDITDELVRRWSEHAGCCPSGEEIREGLASVIDRWEQLGDERFCAPGGEREHEHRWLVLASAREDLPAPVLAIFPDSLAVRKATLVLRRCAGCLEYSVTALRGHWDDKQLSGPVRDIGQPTGQ
jgi:hypothetical protein